MCILCFHTRGYSAHICVCVIFWFDLNPVWWLWLNVCKQSAFLHIDAECPHSFLL